MPLSCLLGCAPLGLDMHEANKTSFSICIGCAESCFKRFGVGYYPERYSLVPLDWFIYL